MRKSVSGRGSIALIPCVSVLMVAASIGAGCGRRSDAPAGAPSGQTATDEAEAVLQSLGPAAVRDAFALLSSNLTAALAEGGPAHALPFCRVEAMPLTESIGEAYAMDVRRVAVRARNPRNRTSPRAAAVFEEMRAAFAAGQAAQPMVRHDEQGPVFYAPIVLNNPVCLVCHGRPEADIAPETLALLRDLYPDDEATGFQMGDLRGLWEVRLRPR